jgi:hypothetical protein
MDESLWASVLRSAGNDIETRLIDPTELSEHLPVTRRDVMATIDAIDYLREYVHSRAKDGDWTYWLGYEWAFRQIVSSRRRLPSPGDKLLFAELAFLVIDASDESPLSRRIEALEVSYQPIRQKLESFTTDQAYAERDDLILLGSAVPDGTALAIALELRNIGPVRNAAVELLNALCV